MLARMQRAEPMPVSEGPDTTGLADYAKLHALLRATEPMSESGEGGSHTDVLRFEPTRLAHAIAELRAEPESSPAVAALYDALSRRYLVKKGKIHLFSMPLLGAEQNHIRRGLVSSAFGPLGYNLMPTYEKTLLDAHEAARVIPYFGSGDGSHFFAPDFLRGFDAGPAPLPDRNDDAVFVRVLGRRSNLAHTAYRLFETDDYFHGRVESAADLESFQQFVRRNPLIPAMQEKLAEFFEAPITVGLRDAMRWARGSRHPHMPWDQARSLIESCFERFGMENFLLPEITYYSYDTAYTPRQIAALLGRNAEAAGAFAEQVRGELGGRARGEWLRAGDVDVAFELLDYHHDYPLYEVEPYAGFLSGMAVRSVGRIARSIVLQNTGLPEPDRRNLDLTRVPPFHTGFGAFLASLDGSDREQAMAALTRLLQRYERRGLRDKRGEPLCFERIPRTFYTFQKLANAVDAAGRVLAVHELDELWSGEKAALWQRYPQLSEKLVVFFSLVYRYFIETGFVPDLRPRDAGRDIFVFGIWGYVTENLLVVEEELADGSRDVRVVFVDNRDQFKQYRRVEDRRKPLGPAKYALRLAYPLIEPAMQRSIGIFAAQVRERRFGPVPTEPAGLWQAADRGLDVTRTVVQSSVDRLFVNTNAVVDDLVDDLHVGAKRALGNLSRRVEQWRPAWPPARAPNRPRRVRFPWLGSDDDG